MPQKALTLSRKVDECKPLATGPALTAIVAGQITAAVVNLYDTTGRLTTAPAETVARDYFKCSVTDKTGAVQFAAATSVGFYTDVAMTTQGGAVQVDPTKPELKSRLVSALETKM